MRNRFLWSLVKRCMLRWSPQLFLSSEIQLFNDQNKIVSVFLDPIPRISSTSISSKIIEKHEKPSKSWKLKANPKYNAWAVIFCTHSLAKGGHCSVRLCYRHRATPITAMLYRENHAYRTVQVLIEDFYDFSCFFLWLFMIFNAFWWYRCRRGTFEDER